MSAQTDLWDSVVADVITLTNRPELVAETALGVAQGTRRAHFVDLFPRDLVFFTAGPSVTSSYTLSYDTSALFPRYRNVSSVKLMDQNGVILEAPEVQIVELNDLYEPGYPGVRRSPIAYQAGSNLNIYTCSGTYGVQVAWFQSPFTDRNNYNSWIAQNFPDVIVWNAAMFVWNRSGHEAKAKEAYTILHGSPMNPDDGLYQQLKMNFLTTAGR